MILKYCFASIICLFFAIGKTMGQEVKTYYGLNSMPPKVRAEYEEKEHFKQLTDSLFLAGAYDTLIAVAEKAQGNWKFATRAKYNLIAAYYERGDTEKSDYLLMKHLKAQSDYFSALFLLSSTSIAMLQYVQVPSNRSKITRFVISQYKKEHIKEPEFGLSLLKLYITDQWIRRNAMNDFEHTDYSKGSFNKDAEKEEMDVFAIYKKAGHIFSKEDIGEEMYNNQFLLLAHEGNMKNRSYYLALIKKSVINKVCPVTVELDFILRTEYIKNPKVFFATLKTRIATIRKKYNIPDYTYNIGF